jgi:ABC-type protease/lipase transport system fused ATPase/permease subunit
MIAGMPGSFPHEMAERGRSLPAKQRQLIALAAPTWWTAILLVRRDGSHAALWAALAGDAELVA